MATGRATLIGDTGYSDVSGLNVQGGVMYGLTLKRQLLNVTSGTASVLRDTGLDFTGMP
ncbi:hypothetical protein [Deinococcus sp. Arct2-2]|uniref:hypothetical protein n=1 Tax=Deinococcus sp. Arct2-2 TaxID=2568653 RepID=UPI001454D5C2|nr:hypothetical protein [Deinococcus sp. Arct2-2]